MTFNRAKAATGPLIVTQELHQEPFDHLSQVEPSIVSLKLVPLQQSNETKNATYLKVKANRYETQGSFQRAKNVS